MHNQLSISSINEEQHLLTTLKMLHILYPVQSVVHVGSGQGVGTMHLWQQFEPQNALFIDAMPLSSKIEKVLQNQPEWSFKQLLVSESNKEKLFYETTNPNENGLLNPESLNTIWSNLKEKKSYFLPSTTLDNAYEIEPNWLVIDTLTALNILSTSTRTVTNVDVIFARTIKNELSEIEEFLKKYELKLCIVIEGIHPSIAEAVFVKDYSSFSKVKIEKLTKEAQAQEAQTKEIQKELETLRAAKSTTEQKCKELESKQQELQSKAEQLSQEKEKLTSELESNKKSVQETLSAKEQTIATLQNEKTTLTKQKQDLEVQNKTQDESIKTKEQAIKTLQEAHAKEKEQAQKLLQEEHAKLEKLTKDFHSQEAQTKEIQKELETLRAAKSTAEQKCKELESKQQALVVKEQRIPQLESELSETRYKQQALENELIKAEAQIELIKDLLLREPGL